MSQDAACTGYLVSHFANKTVPFRFRGIDFTFDLSQGLFSSAGVDVGTQLLLRVLSGLLDEYTQAGKPLPRQVLDAGCGAGLIGICAASALSALGVPSEGPNALSLRCQDRDDLARLFTLHNAGKNRLPPAVLEAHTEPLLAGPKDGRWDLILSNVPAKAGTPVLEDFARRSLGLLKPGGKVGMVVVHRLAGFFRSQIALARAELLSEHNGSGHSVFVYAAGEQQDSVSPVEAGSGFLSRHPFYARALAQCKIEDIPIRIETVHGASGFDDPGDAVTVAAKLATRIGLGKSALGDNAPMLVHEPGQGFFPCWLLEFMHGSLGLKETPPMVLSGRNILALEAARHNVLRQYALRNNTAGLSVVPATDLHLGKAALLNAGHEKRYASLVAFPELLPQSSLPKGTDQLAALWNALPPLLAAGAVFLVAFGSSDAERFDRKKPTGFTRLGGIKRSGFRALAYRS